MTARPGRHLQIVTATVIWHMQTSVFQGRRAIECMQAVYLKTNSKQSG